MNSIHMSRIATQGCSIADAHLAVRWIGRAGPRLLVRPWRLDEGSVAATAEVHAAAVDERNVALNANRRLGSIGNAMVTRRVSMLLTPLLTPAVVAIAALSLGCASLHTSKLTDPIVSQGSCVPPPDSRQGNQVTSQSGTEC